MSQPQGPLPPEIYRRRRIAALGAAFVLLVVIVVVVAVSCSGGSSDSGSDAASAEAAATVSGSMTPADPGDTAAAASETKTESAEKSGAGADGSGGDGGARGDGGDGEDHAPDVTPGGQCPDAAIAVTISPEKSNYDSGDPVTFFTTVENTADVPCVRDLSGAKIVNTVAAVDGDQVWSNADCFPGTGSDIRTLAPGDEARFKMTWAGTYSSNGCDPADRAPVPAGVYAATAHIGGKASKPAPFNIH